MRVKLLSEPTLGLVLILAISAIIVNAEILPEYDESTNLNEVFDGFDAISSNFNVWTNSSTQRDFYNDLNDCYECQHGTQYQATIIRHGCSMSKDDPVSILFALQ